MTYKKSQFISNESNDQIFYEIITNQFTPFPVEVPLAHFGPLISLFKLLHTCRFYKFNFTITFFLLIFKTCLQKND